MGSSPLVSTTNACNRKIAGVFLCRVLVDFAAPKQQNKSNIYACERCIEWGWKDNQHAKKEDLNMKLTGFVKDLVISVLCALPIFLYCAVFSLLA